MKCLQKLFVLAVIAFLTLGLARSIWAPKAINSYENRYAEQMPAVSVAGYLDTTFQDGVEAGLMDQVPLAQTMKSFYNRTHARWVLSMVDALYGEEKTQYVAYEGLRLFGENYLVNWTRTLETSQEDLDRKIQALNATFARHPELDFYVYYIEKDTDIDFITGEKSGLAEYLRRSLPWTALRSLPKSFTKQTPIGTTQAPMRAIASSTTCWAVRGLSSSRLGRRSWWATRSAG